MKIASRYFKLDAISHSLFANMSTSDAEHRTEIHNEYTGSEELRNGICLKLGQRLQKRLPGS